MIMKKIVGEILKGKNINYNLQEYYGRFMEINNKYAMIRLAMNYYTYYSMVAENHGIADTENLSGISVMNEVMDHAFHYEKVNLSEDIATLENLRNDILQKVQDLTCYVDKFNIYEHALNRVEYRFRDQEFPKGYSDENFTRKLMRFILEDEDNMEINRKISQVVGQLPIHYTKSKFYETLSNGFSIYKGGTKQSFQDFLYMIKTSSMLQQSETMGENYPYLKESFDEICEVCFKDITKEQYDDVRRHLDMISADIEERMNSNMMIQEIINDLLVVLYTENHKPDDGVVRACEEIISNTNLLFLGKISPKTEEEIEDMFVMLEGTQEEIYPKLSAYDVTDQIRESYSEAVAELNLEEEYNIVYKLPKLNSDSIFIELDKEEDNSVADETFVEGELNKLFEEYAELFSQNEKVINRAVMSMAISELPVFFNNISELQDFIYNTLSICNDKAEKLACIEILNEIG